jgi:integrase/recombinase XerD
MSRSSLGILSFPERGITFPVGYQPMPLRKPAPTPVSAEHESGVIYLRRAQWDDVWQYLVTKRDVTDSGRTKENLKSAFRLLCDRFEDQAFDRESFEAVATSLREQFSPSYFRAVAGLAVHLDAYFELGQLTDYLKPQRKVGVVDKYISQDLVEHLSTRQRLGRRTITTRVSRIRCFLRWLETNPAPLDARTVERFLFYLQDERHLSGTTRNTYLVALQSYDSYLKDRGHTERLVEGFERFHEEDPNIIPLTGPEIQLIKRYCLSTTSKSLTTQSCLDVTVFLIDTGARWEDAQAIKPADVDLVGQELSYVQAKTGRRRSVHLEDSLLAVLQRRVADKSSGRFVFYNTTGNMLHYPDYHDFLRDLAQRLGITKRVSPHVLRHSYAQNFYDEVRDILLTKDLIGHSSLNSTMRYVRNSKARLREAQMIHPHVSSNVPARRVKAAKQLLEAMKLDVDPQFDGAMVERALGDFVQALYAAVRQ